MNYSWIIPIGGTETQQNVNRCVDALQKIFDPLDEIVVVRHASERRSIDPLVSKLSCFVKILDHPAIRTAAAARNIALENCRYRQIIFQDVDDVPHLNRREIISDNLLTPGMIVSTGYHTFFDGEERGKRTPNPFSSLFYFRTNIFLPTTAIYLRQDEIIYFDDLKIGEDTIFFAKLLHRGYKVIQLKESTVDYHISTAKISTKRGFHGIINEFQYRIVLFKYTGTLLQKSLVITGCICFSLMKTLPKILFNIIYTKGHKSE